MNTNFLLRIANRFSIKGIVSKIEPLGECFINDTFIVSTESAEHNLIRTNAQYKLLQSMEEQYSAMCNIVKVEYAKALQSK